MGDHAEVYWFWTINIKSEHGFTVRVSHHADGIFHIGSGAIHCCFRYDEVKFFYDAGSMSIDHGVCVVSGLSQEDMKRIYEKIKETISVLRAAV